MSSWNRGHRYRSGAGRGGPRAPQASLPQKPLGPVIDSVDAKTLWIDEEAPTIQDAGYVASYNWLEGKHPIILVPGCPPKWTPPAVDTHLDPDSGVAFRDLNAARFSSYPMEPTVQSILSLHPNFNLQAVDIIGCGSTFGNLLRFALSQSKAFRFDVDIVADTVFFIRRENSPTDVIEDLRGYGHTFPERYTTWDRETRGSCSHQRIVQYDFGGLRVMVRSETDAYLKNPDEPKATDQGSKTVSDITSSMSEIGSLSVGGINSNALPSTNVPLRLKMQGFKVPQEQIFDIKTRMDGKVFDMGEILPRLWVNQTSKFLIAYHQRGLFNNPKVTDVRSEVKKWEAENAAALGRFHAILNRIIDTVRESETRQVEVSWDGQGPLLITEQIGEKRRVLPLELRNLWESVN